MRVVLLATCGIWSLSLMLLFHRFMLLQQLPWNGESSENVQSKSSVQINEQQKKEVKRSLLHAMPMSFQGGFKSSKQGRPQQDNQSRQTLKLDGSCPGVPYITEDSAECQLQQHRKENISQVCQSTIKGDPKYDFGLKGLAKNFMHGNIVLVCNAKCGTTSLLRVWCYSLGRKLCDPSRDPHYAIPRAALPAKGAFPENDNKTKLISVRNPWARLVSAWIDKFITSEEYIYECKVYDRWENFQNWKIENNEIWTFQEYLDKCVLYEHQNVDVHEINPHWRSQYLMGGFCHLTYTYIASVETMTMDMPIIMKLMGINETASMMNKSKNYLKPHEARKTSQAAFLTAWKSVTRHTIEALTEAFEIDIEMFGYPRWPF